MSSIIDTGHRRIPWKLLVLLSVALLGALVMAFASQKGVQAPAMETPHEVTQPPVLSQLGEAKTEIVTTPIPVTATKPDEQFYSIQPNLEHWRGLPLSERLLTPRSTDDAKWMLQVGYPQLQDVQASPDYATFFEVPMLDGIYPVNVAIARKMMQGDPAWREFANGIFTKSPFAARALLEDSLAPGQGVGDEARRQQMETYWAAAILLGDSDATYSVRLARQNPTFQTFGGNDLETLVAAMATSNRLNQQRGRAPLVVIWRPLIRPDGG